ncbi:MAG TPA: MFS transporter, partial [Actinoplanes sp.]|nr:MFS transporter [Actinoplanes sp.]
MPRPAAAGSYRAVLLLPSASRTFVPALGGRLAYGLLPLATLFTIQQATGSYAAAGLALALFGLASITLPLKARYLALLPWLALVCALCLGAAALTPWPVVFVGLAGLAAPPLGPAMRATWRSLTEGTSLKERAYALDSIAEESLYLLGPLLAGLLIAVAPARFALLLTAGLLLAGTVGMVLAAPAP